MSQEIIDKTSGGFPVGAGYTCHGEAEGGAGYRPDGCVDDRASPVGAADI